MELRICERPEPSHIHIPRPSRLQGSSQQMPAFEMADARPAYFDGEECQPHDPS